jgi:hypothetical protein
MAQAASVEGAVEKAGAFESVYKYLKVYTKGPKIKFKAFASFAQIAASIGENDCVRARAFSFLNKAIKKCP